MHAVQEIVASWLPEWKRDINRRLASLRTIVECPFCVAERHFGFTDVRYRGFYKNGQTLTTKLALANPYPVRRTLFDAAG